MKIQSDVKASEQDFFQSDDVPNIAIKINSWGATAIIAENNEKIIQLQ